MLLYKERDVMAHLCIYVAVVAWNRLEQKSESGHVLGVAQCTCNCIQWFVIKYKELISFLTEHWLVSSYVDSLFILLMPQASIFTVSVY